MQGVTSVANGTVKLMQSKLAVFELKATKTLTAYGITVFDISISRSGYKALGIVGYFVTGSGKCAVRSAYLKANNADGTSTISDGYAAVEILNTESATPSVTARIHVLYEKL